jgi:hypothetical protein
VTNVVQYTENIELEVTNVVEQTANTESKAKNVEEKTEKDNEKVQGGLIEDFTTFIFSFLGDATLKVLHFESRLFSIRKFLLFFARRFREIFTAFSLYFRGFFMTFARPFCRYFRAFRRPSQTFRMISRFILGVYRGISAAYSQSFDGISAASSKSFHHALTTRRPGFPELPHIRSSRAMKPSLLFLVAVRVLCSTNLHMDQIPAPNTGVLVLPPCSMSW